MKIKFNNKYIKWGFTAFMVIACSILFGYITFNGKELLSNISNLFSLFLPVFVGFIVAYLLTPIVNLIENKILYPIILKCKAKDLTKHKKWVRAVSILFTYIFVFLLIYSIIAMMISQIVPSIQNIIMNFDGYVKNVTSWLNNLTLKNDELYGTFATVFTKLMVELDKWLTDTVNLILNSFGEFIKTFSLSLINTLGVLWDVIIGFVISVYVLASKETFISQSKKIIYALFERNYANQVLDSLRFTHKTFIGFISGKIIDSLIIGILCFIGTSILQTPYAALVSVIVGITNVIPFFGPYLGAIPSAILILIVDLQNPLNCVYFCIFILALQQFDGNILGPYILGDSTGLSGFWVIFSITIFGAIFGIPGMIIGVPTFAVLYAGIKALINSSLKKKELPIETTLYYSLDSINEEGSIVKMETVEEKKNSIKDIKKTNIFSKIWLWIKNLFTKFKKKK
ncbi:MAG: AI-2E family transporter [Lachnospiraceae bacterium]|nr:AI-2E family transporter [Lachnospiraceae bacterium]